jgi:dipeptidyl aminopeptidase/acylaminoacyl peptidase
VTLLCKRPRTLAQEIVPAPFSVRSRVHEYGGGAFAVENGIVIFANDSDQRLYCIDARDSVPGQPQVLTAEPGMRFADLQFDGGRRSLIAVAERAREGQEPENFIASIDLASGEVRPLVRGADFYAFPRLDATGRRLAFLSWKHPCMPWDACELQLATLDDAGAITSLEKVAGGPHESIFQPAWSPAGRLHFVSDRAGFSQIYRQSDDGGSTCLCAVEAEFSTPLWVFGLSTYAFLNEGTIACVFQQSGFWHLATLHGSTGELRRIDTRLTELGYVQARAGRAYFVGGSPSEEPAIHQLDASSREPTLVHRPSSALVAIEAIAQPQTVDFPTTAGATAHGLLYLPASPTDESLPGEKPPLLVICHGGPTGSTSTALNLTIQFWTSRGFAVLDVNYRGSTGYGRAYRKALDGQWGVADVEDCVAGARALAERGIVDGARMAIRGSSAGGFTVLCALAFHDVFAAGASYYGVSDLEALARDTHKFESHYLESLIGPYPEQSERYRARSPIRVAEKLSCPVIFFQGLQDRVVPPDQAERMVAALHRRNVEAPLIVFPDEQHGFRRKETVVRAIEAELVFYRRVFAIPGAD